MYPDPDLGEYDIGGEKFTLMDGIVGLAHSPAQGLLYYQPLATDRWGYFGAIIIYNHLMMAYKYNLPSKWVIKIIFGAAVNPKAMFYYS